MKLTLFKKICLTVMGVGVVSSLMSVGTFATFTATTTNPGNSFAAGTLTLKDTTNFTAFALTNPNSNGSTDPRGVLAECSAAGGVVASTCSTILKSTNVTAEGMEPGQYLQGQITIQNTGTLPATVALQVQNATSTTGTCGTGVTCVDLAGGVLVTIQDTTKTQCVFGGFDFTSGTSNGTHAAPVPAASLSGSIASIPAGSYIAGSALSTAATTGNCDNITDTTAGTNNLGTSASPASTTPPANDVFTAFKALTSSGAGNLIWIPGNGSTKSLTNGGTVGSIVNIPQWAGGTTNESHTFTITVALPDAGVVTNATLGTDTIVQGNDNKYQNGSVSFDLVWYAFQ